MKNKIFKSLIGLIILLFLVVLYALFDNKPGTFYIESFNQTIGSSSLNELKWSKSKNAREYKVIIKDNNKKILKEVTTSNNSFVINDLNLIDTSFTVDIIAYNQEGKSRKVKKRKTYQWSLPIINVSQNEIVVSKRSDIKDFTIDLSNGNNKNNYVVISKDGKDIHRLNLNNMTIDASIFKDLDAYLGKYEILLCHDYDKKRLVLHKTYIDIVPIPITDIVINTPLSNSEVSFEDLLVNFDMSKYADKYYYTLKDETGKTIINNILINSQQFTISKEKLKADTSYTLTITGHHYLDDKVTKLVSTNFKVAPANKVSKIISTRSSGEIGKNRAVRLSTYTDATIYYTLDGSVPTKDSIEYTGSIFIDHDLTLKAIAIKEGMIDSDILELKFKAVEKPPAIYLSPSTQDDNLGVAAVGYTTEMRMMNKVSDYIEERLKQKNIIVYRNRSNMTLSEIVNDSSKYDVDLHLAIHSNGYEGDAFGVETWVHDHTSKEAIKIASLIQDALMEIYYNPKGDRGVRYSAELGGMRETNPKNVTNGVLVEMAFHNYYYDAKWIVDNQKKIGYAIADAVETYLKK